MNNDLSGSEQKVSWVWTTRTLVIAVLCVGPLALPLLWLNKRYSLTQKLLWTCALVVATYFTVVFTTETINKVLAQYRELGLIQ